MESDGSRSYAYSSDNLMVSSTAASGTTTLGYDPMGRLQSTSSGYRFVHDGDALALEYNAGGALLRRYVHGPGVDEPLVWYNGADTSTRRWLHADERGSITAISQADGTIWNVSAYDEYGVPGPWNFGRFQYTGQLWLPEIGLYYYKARMYNPITGGGRFMQVDPIGYEDQLNLYA